MQRKIPNELLFMACTVMDAGCMCIVVDERV
jgi:hypothetical protein